MTQIQVTTPAGTDTRLVTVTVCWQGPQETAPHNFAVTARINHMKTRPVFRAARRNRMRGMSLIETMVGMTLGILVSLIITQVWGVFENQKQRTVSATAGQATGSAGTDGAGAGCAQCRRGARPIRRMFNCGTIFSYYESGGTQISPVPAYTGSMGLAPVQIVDGGAATASDTIIVKRGSDFLGAIPATLTGNMPNPCV